MPALTTVALCFFSDVTTFDKNCHHLYSSSAGGKGLSNDTQIRVIGLAEPEICTEILRNLTEKLGAKLCANTRGYSMIKFVSLDDAFSEFLNWKQD